MIKSHQYFSLLPLDLRQYFARSYFSRKYHLILRQLPEFNFLESNHTQIDLLSHVIKRNYATLAQSLLTRQKFSAASVAAIYSAALKYHRFDILRWLLSNNFAFDLTKWHRVPNRPDMVQILAQLQQRGHDIGEFTTLFIRQNQIGQVQEMLLHKLRKFNRVCNYLVAAFESKSPAMLRLVCNFIIGKSTGGDAKGVRGLKAKRKIDLDHYCNNKVTELAVWHGNLELLQIVQHEYNCQLTMHTLSAAAEFLLEDEPITTSAVEEPMTVDATDNGAVAGDSVMIITEPTVAITEPMIITKPTVANSSMTTMSPQIIEATKMVEYLLEQKCPYCNETITAFAEAGRGDLLLPLLGATIVQPQIYMNIALAAANYGRIELLQLLESQRVIIDHEILPDEPYLSSGKIIRMAARNGQLATVKFCLANGALLDERVFTAAIKGDSLALLQWLQQQNCPIPSGSISLLCLTTNFPLLLWIYDNYPQLCSEPVMADRLRHEISDECCHWLWRRKLLSGPFPYDILSRIARMSTAEQNSAAAAIELKDQVLGRIAAHGDVVTMKWLWQISHPSMVSEGNALFAIQQLLLVSLMTKAISHGKLEMLKLLWPFYRLAFDEKWLTDARENNAFDLADWLESQRPVKRPLKRKITVQTEAKRRKRTAIIED